MEPTESQNADTITIGPHPSGHGYRLETSQLLAQSRERLFEFFADAFQLETLTPGWLHFSVLNQPPIRIARGTLIDYRLRLHGLPIRWQSAISEWEPPVRFVDEQTRGPYRRWHHEHQFEVVDDGTLCHDIVDYQVYGGSLINTFFVRRDLLKIFRFRQNKMRELFN